MTDSSTTVFEPGADRVIQVLDHGFVRLVDHMGDDQRIVDAARVSYGDGTRSVRENAQLIDYLLRNDHTSPFEQVVFTFQLKMPIFVARQWIRHRMARLNEVSGRYSVLPSEMYVPESERVQAQSSINKQGSAEVLPPELNARAREVLEAGQGRAYEEYEELLELGVARELARVNLPVSLYTEMYWQMDLNNLFRFLRLRLDEHAQWEIRVFAEAIAEFVKQVVPASWAAMEEHVLRGQRLSGSELDVVRESLDLERFVAALEASGLRASRRRELLAKLGVSLPAAGVAAAAD